MKGPYERLKYDGRRVWECPRCHHRQRSEGSVTTAICRCQSNEPTANRVSMRLVEEGFQQYHPRVMPLSPRETIGTGPQSDSGEVAERADRLTTANDPETSAAQETAAKNEPFAVREISEAGKASESRETSEANESGVAPDPSPPSPDE